MQTTTVETRGLAAADMDNTRNTQEEEEESFQTKTFSQFEISRSRLRKCKITWAINPPGLSYLCASVCVCV